MKVDFPTVKTIGDMIRLIVSDDEHTNVGLKWLRDHDEMLKIISYDRGTKIDTTHAYVRMVGASRLSINNGRGIESLRFGVLGYHKGSGAKLGLCKDEQILDDVPCINTLKVWFSLTKRMGI